MEEDFIFGKDSKDTEKQISVFKFFQYFSKNQNEEFLMEEELKKHGFIHSSPTLESAFAVASYKAKGSFYIIEYKIPENQVIRRKPQTKKNNWMDDFEFTHLLAVPKKICAKY